MPAPAPDYATLFDVEDPIEAAVKSILTAGGATPCLTQREVDDVPASRIDIRLELGGAFNKRENAWNAQLIIDIFTDRAVNAKGVMGQRRGLVRSLLSRVPPGENFHPDFDDVLLPYHVINSFDQSGTRPQLRIDEDTDWSQLTYDLIISIRPGAFPL